MMCARHVGQSVARAGILLLSVVLLLFSAGQVSAAGQVATGSIIGQVTDESGGVMPGVTVTATSPALQVQEMTAVTDSKGEYRLTLLSIGVYRVKYELQGFQTIERTDVTLTAGFIAKIDIVMKVGTLEESVIVSGQSPVVDVTNTTQSTVLTNDSLEELPTTRNSLISLAQAAPGVRIASGGFDVGGSLFSLTPSFNVFGQSGDDFVMVDGALITGATGGTKGNYADFNTVQEAEVRTIGKGAEMPGSGLYLNTIVKSGENDYHGSAYYGFTGPWAQANNIDADLEARGGRGTGDLKFRRDLNGEIGGRIVENKLWFYTSARRSWDDQYVAGCVTPEGENGNEIKWVPFATAKVSYQMAATQKLSGTYQWNRKHRIYGCNNLTAWESRIDHDQSGSVLSIGWTGTFGSSVATQIQYGYWDFNSDHPGFARGKVATNDQVTTKWWGNYRQDNWWDHQYRHSWRGSLSVFKNDWWQGDHEFKAGFEYLPGTDSTEYGGSTDGNPKGDYYVILRSGAPYQVRTYNTPAYPINKATYIGAYFQDTWTIARRLTLGLGLRYDGNAAFLPEQSRVAGTFAAAKTFDEVVPPRWNAVAPRLHFALDATGDGKTVIKGGWARFNQMRNSGDVSRFNQNAWIQTTWRWRDLNGNLDYDPGEVNLDPNGPDYVSQTGGITRLPSEDERQPRTDELSVSFEREIIANVALRVSGVYSRVSDRRMLEEPLRPYEVYTIPITVPDPGPDGRSPTGATVTYWEYPVAYRGQAFAVTQPINRYTSTYRSMEIALTRRLTGNWQTMTSFSMTKANTPYRSEFITYTPNAETHGSDETWQWFAKVGGSYHFPYDIVTSASFQAVSGEPFQRTVLARGGVTIPSLVVPVEPWGAQHYDNVYLLDIRAQKSFRLAASQKVTLQFDVFNVANANTITNMVVQSGPTYGNLGEITTGSRPPFLPARIAMFNFGYSF